MNKQAGAKLYWRRDQEPDLYRIYRSDANSGDKRTVDGDLSAGTEECRLHYTYGKKYRFLII